MEWTLLSERVTWTTKLRECDSWSTDDLTEKLKNGSLWMRIVGMGISDSLFKIKSFSSQFLCRPESSKSKAKNILRRTFKLSHLHNWQTDNWEKTTATGQLHRNEATAKAAKADWLQFVDVVSPCLVSVINNFCTNNKSCWVSRPKTRAEHLIHQLLILWHLTFITACQP